MANIRNRKSMLVFGLKPDPPEKTQSQWNTLTIPAALEAQIKAAEAVDIDMVVELVDPDVTSAATVSAARKTLRARKWDIVCIGGGLRMVLSLTPILEQLVNATMEECADHGTKLSFATSPTALVEGAQRVLAQYES
jgi:hypothetical protein